MASPCLLLVLLEVIVCTSLQDGMWDSMAATMKVEVDGETHGEEYEVHLEELNGVW
jgi:hypothetical protein